jgi:CheY-like chemotaxis protein
MVALEDATVLVVDDETPIREMYVDMLEGVVARIERAEDGEAALSTMDDTVDVVFLDRRMPGPSGGAVLEEIRERGYDCRVAMLTAVEPDEDIALMPFDTYLTKPVSVAELRETVERLLALDDYESALEERFRVAQKLGALESSKSPHELEASEAYADLRARYERLTEEMEEAGHQVDTDLVRGVIEPSASKE